MTLVATGPMKLLTTANSINERNTNTEHDDIHTSTALTYDTGGNDCCDCVF